MTEASNHWSNAKESGSLIGMKILLWVYRIFGRVGFRIILFPVMGYYYWAHSPARNASKKYLRLLSPFLDVKQRHSLTSFRHFMMFGEMMLDKFLVWMGHIGREDVTFETPIVLNQMDQSTKGGIIIVSHLGNAEVCNALGQQLPNIRLTLVVNTHHAAKFNSLMKKLNSSPRIKILQVNDMSPASAMLLSERIDEGEFIVIAADRTSEHEGQGRISDVLFLGEKAPMPQGAFILASLLKCPVYLMFCLKQQSRYHIYVELFSEQLKIARKQRNQMVNEIVQTYADRLQYYCTKAPLQWFNFFDFWRDNGVESVENNKVNSSLNYKDKS